MYYQNISLWLASFSAFACMTVSAVERSFSESPDLTTPVDVELAPTVTPLPRNLQPVATGNRQEVQPAATATQSPASAPQQARKLREPLVPAGTKAQTLPLEEALGKQDINAIVLSAIGEMPKGGGYATSSKAAANFGKAASLSAGKKLRISPEGATPSFCSSATYLVLLKALEKLQTSGALSMDEATLRMLLWKRQPDGVGVWGRWNANGPGTARLFYELNAGDNFIDISKARRGDFLKIWWTDEIGAKERGHLVVFLGVRTDENGQEFLRFWSSNQPDGYSEKEVPLAKAKRVIFSRLTRPQGFADIAKLPSKDAFLASMLTDSFTMEQVKDMTGAK